MAIVSAGVRRVVFWVKLSVRYHVFAYLSCIARMTASPSDGSALDPTRIPPTGAISAAATATRTPMANNEIIRAPLFGSLVHRCRIGGGQFSEKGADAGRHRFEKARTLLGRCGGRIAGARVRRDTRPWSGSPGPAFAQARDGCLLLSAVAGVGQRQQQLWRDVLHDACLELAGVITRLVEILIRVNARPPVERAEKHARVRLQLADHLAEIISAMAIEDDELENSLALQHTREITQQRGLSARIHVQAQLDVELPGVHAEWNSRQHHYSRPGIPRDPRRLGGYRIALDDVGRVWQMVIVRFGSTPRKNRDLIVRLRDGFPGGFCQDPGARRHDSKVTSHVHPASVDRLPRHP